MVNDFDQTDVETSEEKEEVKDDHVKFTCPNDGEISRDDVVFLCNTCESADVVYTEGMYICPSCMEPGQNFECMLCGSKEVIMTLNS